MKDESLIDKTENDDVVSEFRDNMFNKPKISKKEVRYQYSYVPMPVVEADIDQYIIPELQEACKSLWDRNVFTFMCSNREDFGSAYIILDTLSPENKAIFEQLKQDYPEHFVFDNYRCANRIQISDVTKMSEQEISNAFLKLVNDFILQDVQPKFYMSSEQYLIKCGCYDEIPNPKYEENPGPMPTTSFKEIDEWLVKIHTPKFMKVFNKDKMDKSFEEYVRDNGDEKRTDFETGNVYDSPYFLEKHNKFVSLQADEWTP